MSVFLCCITCSSIIRQAFTQRGWSEWCFFNVFAASSDLPVSAPLPPQRRPSPGLPHTPPLVECAWGLFMVPLLVEAFTPVSYGVEIPDCKGLHLVCQTEDLPRELAGFRAIKQKYFSRSSSTTEKSHRWKTPLSNKRECEAWIQTGFESQLCHRLSFVAIGQATRFLWAPLYLSVKWIKKWPPKALVRTRKKVFL